MESNTVHKFLFVVDIRNLGPYGNLHLDPYRIWVHQVVELELHCMLNLVRPMTGSNCS